MIEREDRDGVRVLRLVHGKANAMDVELLHALEREIGEYVASPMRAAVVTSGTRIFCAGVDLKRLVDGGAAYVREFLPALERALASAFTCGKPLVAAINGHAIAGGFILASACDRRLMAEGTGRVGLPELHVGVPFPTLVLEILRASVPPPRLQEMLLLGGTQDASSAVASGLVDELVAPESLLDAACDVARRMGSLPPSAYALTKRKLREPFVSAWRERAGDGDREIVERWCEPSTLDAIARFVEKTLR